MNRKLSNLDLNSFKRASPFWIFVLLLLLPSTLISPKAFIRAIYPLFILGALLNNRKTLFLVLSPFGLLAPAAIFFWYHFHSPPNATLWLIMNGSNLTEAWDFAIAYSLPLLLAILAVLVFLLKSFKRTAGPLYRSQKLRWAAALLVAVPLQTFFKSKNLDQFQYDLGHHFSASYPWNLLMSYQLAQRELQKFKHITLKDSESKVILQDPTGSTGSNGYNGSTGINKDSQVVVLVIGESARRDRHSLYGYEKPTNPLLEQEPNLVKVQDAITLHPHTIASVPVILTGIDVAKGVDQVPWSVVQYFKKAGFKTYWFSNQASLGDEDSLLGFYGKSSDHSEFLHVHSHSLPWAHDGELLKPFMKAMDEKTRDAQPPEKKFFVIHLQGSHYGFKRRYPETFEMFEDPYDNTILYTDSVLSQIIERLKKEPETQSSLLYLSDHGILLNQCGKEFSHFDSKESYQIPYFFWFNDPSKRVPKTSPFWSNIEKRVTTQSVLFTILDIAGIQIQSEQANTHSLLRAEFNENERWVQTYSQSVNYDEAENSDSCHLEPKK